MVVKKKKAVSKPKKTAKKVAAKSAKPKAKSSEKKTILVQPVTDSGVVTMRPVDDPGVASEGETATVKPEYDAETGVIVMVPK